MLTVFAKLGKQIEQILASRSIVLPRQRGTKLDDDIEGHKSMLRLVENFSHQPLAAIPVYSPRKRLPAGNHTQPRGGKAIGSEAHHIQSA